MSVLLNIIFIIGLFAMFFFGPTAMNIGLCRMSNDKMKLAAGDGLKCCIPVFNHFYGWHCYTGTSYLSISGIVTVIFYLSLASRFIVMVFLFNNDAVQTATVIIFLISAVAYWIGCAVDVFRVLSDSGIYALGAKVMNALLLIVGQIVIGFYMPNNILYYEKDKKGSV